MHAVGALFGRRNVGIAVVGALMGTLVGDTPAMTGRGPPPTEIRIEQSVPHREASYVAGAVRQASRALAPLGIDQLDVLRSMTSASISVDVDGDHLLQEPGSSGLEIRAGTRITARVSHTGFQVTANPGFPWRLQGAPDPDIEALSYDFATARFDVTASGWGPDAIYEYLATTQANEGLVSQLPSEMQRPGFDLWKDPQIERHLQTVIDLLRSADPGTGDQQVGRGLSSLSVSLSFAVPHRAIIPLPDSDYSAEVKEGTWIDLSASFSGPLDGSRLESITVRFSRPLEVSPGRAHDSMLRKMDVHSVTLSEGGQIDLDYELGPEQVFDGVRALVALFAMAAEHRPVDLSFERTRMERLRARVQAQIDGEAEPKLAQLLRSHDSAIPGVSLVRLFGLDRGVP